MKILYFSPREYWPLDAGAKLRDYHMATNLANFCSVTYFALRRAEDKGLPSRKESSFAGHYTALVGPRYTFLKIVNGIIGPTPLTILNYSSETASARLRAILVPGSFDSIQIEGVHLSSYIPAIRSSLKNAILVSDWHNVESEILRRYSRVHRNPIRRAYASRTATLLERAEKRFLRLCDVHTVASERERSHLQSRDPTAEIHVIPNGVDVAYYSGLAPDAGASRTKLVFAGSMDYSANVDAVEWFVEEIWPELSLRHLKLSFTIVGRNPTREVRALARDRIAVTGTVEDVRPYYANALAAVVPLRIGSGTRLKILEAMAAGIPVVSTRLGAEGLEVKDGTNLLLADSPGEIIAAIAKLVNSSELWLRLSQSGRELVSTLYDWPVLGERLYRVHCDAFLRLRRRQH